MQRKRATQVEHTTWSQQVRKCGQHFGIAGDVFERLAADDLVEHAAEFWQVVDVHLAKLESVAVRQQSPEVFLVAADLVGAHADT